MYCLVKARTDIDEAQKLSFAIEEGFKLWDFFSHQIEDTHMLSSRLLHVAALGRIIFFKAGFYSSLCKYHIFAVHP